MQQIDRTSTLAGRALEPEIAAAKQRYGIVGNAPALLAAVARALQVAPVDLSVLITGESGSGKEFFPKIIHAYSPRKHGKYIAVNCGAIPEGTIDSELFGHEKGAFTGAVSSRKGYFEEADGGTIFLDEVAELPLTTQARLLRVLETGEFIKVGSSEVQRTNIRVVAATNVDLQAAMQQGRFREDLYYRLSTVRIAVPPLRDRGNDIILLARRFAADFAERHMTAPVELDDSARRLMLSYRWPGNVRQLKNVVEQMALFMAGCSIGADDVREFLPPAALQYAPVPGAQSPRHDYGAEREMLLNLVMGLRSEIDKLRAEVEELREAEPRIMRGPLLTPYSDESQAAPMTAPQPPAAAAQEEPLSLEQTERELIKRALRRHGGNRKDTAAELNISERTLYRKLREFGID